jgi:hypothetical protein
MFINIGNIHINPENITHFIMEGTVLTVYFVGGESLILDESDAKLFISRLAEGGRY